MGSIYRFLNKKTIIKMVLSWTLSRSLSWFDLFDVAFLLALIFPDIICISFRWPSLPLDRIYVELIKIRMKINLYVTNQKNNKKKHTCVKTKLSKNRLNQFPDISLISIFLSPKSIFVIKSAWKIVNIKIANGESK